MKTKNFLEAYQYRDLYAHSEPNFEQHCVGDNFAELKPVDLEQTYKKVQKALRLEGAPRKNYHHNITEGDIIEVLKQRTGLLKDVCSILFYDPKEAKQDQAFYYSTAFDVVFKFIQSHMYPMSALKKANVFKTILAAILKYRIQLSEQNLYIKNGQKTGQKSQSYSQYDNKRGHNQRANSGYISQGQRLEDIDVDLTARDQKFINCILKFCIKNKSFHSCGQIIKANQVFGHLNKKGLQKLAKQCLTEGFKKRLEKGVPHDVKSANPFFMPQPDSKLIHRFIIACCQQIKNTQNLDRLLNWLEQIDTDNAQLNNVKGRGGDEKNKDNIKLFLPSPQHLCIDALFKPYKFQGRRTKYEHDDGTHEQYGTKGQQSRNKPLSTRLEKIADDVLGDPRFNPSPWDSIPDSKSVMMRWKAAKALKNFFALVDKLAEEDEDVARMWPRRKKFIKVYDEAGHIQDAWFILGRDAMGHRDRDKLLERKDCAHLEGHSQHAALMFKIGNLILVERNFNARLRIWKAGGARTPDFYQEKYHANYHMRYRKPPANLKFKDERKLDKEQDELHDESAGELTYFNHHQGLWGNKWEKNVARFIKKETRINKVREF